MSMRRADRSGAVAYLCFDDSKNFGDQLIARLARRQLSMVGLDEFEIVNARNVDVDLREFAAVVIAPGGYLSGKHESDDRENVRWFLDLSAATAEELAAAGVPIFFWGTGVNAWSGRRAFDAEAVQEIRGVLEASAGVFVRGRADLAFLRETVWQDIDQRARFMPCPSLFTKRLLELPDSPPSAMVGINVGADQIGEWSDAPAEGGHAWFAGRIRLVVEHIRSRGFQPVFLPNTPFDNTFCETYFSTDPALLMNDRTAMLGDGMVEWLARFHSVIGMRLHGWLPYVGAGVPSVLISPFPIRQQMPNDLGLPDCYGMRGPFDPDAVIACFDQICAEREALVGEAARVVDREWTRASNFAREVARAVGERSARGAPLTLEADADFWEQRGSRLRKAELYDAAICAYERAGTVLGSYQIAMCRAAKGEDEAAASLFRFVSECDVLQPELAWLREAAQGHLQRLELRWGSSESAAPPG